PNYTLLKDRSTVLVEWQSYPLVELRGVISKQKARDWLRLSQDKASVFITKISCRTLIIDTTRANSGCLKLCVENPRKKAIRDSSFVGESFNVMLTCCFLCFAAALEQ
ncbi:hypothetical protein EDD85DRAFT_769965, partial [Armillaria nabsnona]